MTISTETIQWAMGIVLAVIGWILIQAYNKITKLSDKVLTLENLTPKPGDLATSIAGIGARVGDLESYKAVSKTLMDQMANNLQELHAMRKDDHAYFATIKDDLTEIKISVRELQTKIQLHTEKGD